MSKRVKAKKVCCQSDPRCKTCPVALKRLAISGHAKRLDKRSYLLLGGAKRALKRARAR